MAQRVFEKRPLVCEHEELSEEEVADEHLRNARHVLNKHRAVGVAGTSVKLVAESFAHEASHHKGYGLAEWEMVAALWEAALLVERVKLFPGYLPHGDPVVIEYVWPTLSPLMLQAVTVSTGFVHPENFVALHFLDQGE